MTTTRRSMVLLMTLLYLGAVPVLPGCGVRRPEVQAAADDQQFMAWLQGVSNEAKADPKYRQLSINTPEQIESFMLRTHAAYRRKMSVDDYAKWLNASYPGHAYEVTFITERLPR